MPRTIGETMEINSIQDDYNEALEAVISTALMLTVAHRVGDGDAVFDLLDRLSEAMDNFTEICDPGEDADEEDN